MHIQFAEPPVFDQDLAIGFHTDKIGRRVLPDVPEGEGNRMVVSGRIRQTP